MTHKPRDRDPSRNEVIGLFVDGELVFGRMSPVVGPTPANPRHIGLRFLRSVWYDGRIVRLFETTMPRLGLGDADAWNRGYGVTKKGGRR